MRQDRLARAMSGEWRVGGAQSIVAAAERGMVSDALQGKLFKNLEVGSVSQRRGDGVEGNDGLEVSKGSGGEKKG